MTVSKIFIDMMNIDHSEFNKDFFIFQRETAEDSRHQEECEGCYSGGSHDRHHMTGLPGQMFTEGNLQFLMF